MKKNQSGVSLITLVITIIVVIILASVAFSGSFTAIDNATFGTFTSNVSEIQGTVTNTAATLKGKEGAKNTTRSDAQAFNYVAKGASAEKNKKFFDSGEVAWLTTQAANTLAATYIQPETYKEVMGSDLQKMQVNTYLGSNVDVSYFVTKNGSVFIWPPYTYNDKLYVVPDEEKGFLSQLSGEVLGSGEGLKASETVTANIESFKYDGLTINISNSENPTGAPSGDLSNYPVVYYKDDSKPKRPVGAEDVPERFFKSK